MFGKPVGNDPEYDSKITKTMERMREWTINAFLSVFPNKFSTGMKSKSYQVNIRVDPNTVLINRLTFRPVRRKLELADSDQIKELALLRKPILRHLGVKAAHLLINSRVAVGW